jgi:hypothetical protein
LGKVAHDIFRVKTQVRLRNIKPCHSATAGAFEKRCPLRCNNELHRRRQFGYDLFNQMVDYRYIGNELKVI